MEEFTNIAIWLLISFLAFNACIIWFTDLDEFSNNDLGYNNLEENNTFSENSDIVINVFGTEVNCSTAQSDAFNFIPCSLAGVSSSATSIIQSIWNLFTAWSTLFSYILPAPLGGAEGLIAKILGPILGGIAAIGSFAILLRVAGIIRGGS